jgi:hypothetical protein
LAPARRICHFTIPSSSLIRDRRAVPASDRCALTHPSTPTRTLAMPTARIALEQTRTGWSAEIEAGGVMARCRVAHADSFEAIMAAVAAAYHEIAEPPTACEPTPARPLDQADRRAPARPARTRRAA